MGRIILDNETHWKTRDITHIVRSAVKAAGADTRCNRRLSVTYGHEVDLVVSGAPPRDYTILLPRRGPRLSHPNPLYALAASAINVDTALLAPSESWWLANALFFCFTAEAGPTPTMEAVVNTPPTWAPPESLIITKYEDPSKDSAFVAFAAECERKMALAQARIDKYQPQYDASKKKLQRAKRDYDKQKRRLRDAKKRRGVL